MKPDWKQKEDLDNAKKFAENIINIMFDKYLIDDEKFNDAIEYAVTTFADALYEHDEELRNSCRETISLAVAEAVKRTVI